MERLYCISLKQFFELHHRRALLDPICFIQRMTTESAEGNIRRVYHRAVFSFLCPVGSENGTTIKVIWTKTSLADAIGKHKNISTNELPGVRKIRKKYNDICMFVSNKIKNEIIKGVMTTQDDMECSEQGDIDVDYPESVDDTDIIMQAVSEMKQDVEDETDGKTDKEEAPSEEKTVVDETAPETIQED